MVLGLNPGSLPPAQRAPGESFDLTKALMLNQSRTRRIWHEEMHFKESVYTVVGSQLRLSKSRIHRENLQERQPGTLNHRRKPPSTAPWVVPLPPWGSHLIMVFHHTCKVPSQLHLD